jgi:hypothetical protein
MWRWDQGRLQYFNFQNIRATAQGLLQVENANLRAATDPLRPLLPLATGLPFAPDNYRIWRNYNRVFECCLVATAVDNRLLLTDIGRRLAEDDSFTVDEYMSVVAKRFRYPFPAFVDYDDTSERIYPFCAVLKFLFSKLLNGLPATLSVEELETKIIGNSCTGAEPIEHYAALPATGYAYQGDERRQAREMLVFISQFSFLKWNRSQLELDVESSELSTELLNVATPDYFTPRPLREEELLSIAQPIATDFIDFSLPSRDEPSEEEFVEGERVRKTHVRIERSPLLRKAFFKRFSPRQCDMCELNTKARYPWAKNLLELHHLLPLSSAIAVSSTGTLLTDVVPLCPTCHRGVHSYYRVWLNKHAQRDFGSKKEAGEVYVEAKNTLGA